MTWLQVNAALFPERATPPVYVPWNALHDAVTEWRTERRFDHFWFVHKPPGLRLRFQADEPASTLEPVLTPWLADAERRNDLRGFRFAIYEPEEYRFGGPTGIAIAHQLFDFDTARLLPELASGMDAERRARWFVSATQSLLRGAVEDPVEAWDVWCRLESAVAGLEGDGVAPEIGDALEADEIEYREVGARLRACADAGRITVGVRQWCADAALFGSNRLGLGFWPAAMRATIERVAGEPPTIGLGVISAALSAWLGPPTVKQPGFQRGRRPADTVASLAPVMWERFGITRLATVTGLDRIGIPVVMSVRPNSRSLAVSQGKGIDLDSARASALLEAVELWHGEQHQLPRREVFWSELVRETADDPSVDVLDPRVVALSFESHWYDELAIPWVQGFDLNRGNLTWVPYELVHSDARLPLMKGSGCFARNTNGLASGNNRAEAVLHGLCELIERDASTLDFLERNSAIDRRLDPATVDVPAVRELLRSFDAAEVAVMIWDTTTDLGVASFRATISDRLVDPVLRPIPASEGAGTHPDRGVALARALTEAAQSRLTAISGSRDDLSLGHYRVTQSVTALEQHAYSELGPNPRSFTAVPSVSHDTVDDDLAFVLDRCREAGVGPIVAVDLSFADLPVHVIRVVAGVLEAPIETPSYRAGTRARAMVVGRA